MTDTMSYCLLEADHVTETFSHLLVFCISIYVRCYLYFICGKWICLRWVYIFM